jgi:nucleoside-diphosphate-sugar epimerase
LISIPVRTVTSLQTRFACPARIAELSSGTGSERLLASEVIDSDDTRRSDWFASSPNRIDRRICEENAARARRRPGTASIETAYRPAEIDLLIRDASKARAALGWKPKVGFKELVEMMVDDPP